MLKFWFTTKDKKRRICVNDKNEIEIWKQKPMDIPQGFVFYIEYPYNEN